MMGFLPPVYSKILRREKLFLRVFWVFVFLGITLLLGLIFLLPSYFSLIFSLDDVLRILGTEEFSIKRKDVEGLENKISYTNLLLNSYFLDESKRKSFSELILSLTNPVSDGIKLTNIEFKNGSSDESVFHIRGEAQKRSDLILYSQKLRQLDLIKELNFPVSNLLQETNAKFVLEAIINQKYYNNGKN